MGGSNIDRPVPWQPDEVRVGPGIAVLRCLWCALVSNDRIDEPHEAEEDDKGRSHRVPPGLGVMFFGIALIIAQPAEEEH
jgi:hypothetical protein